MRFIFILFLMVLSCQSFGQIHEYTLQNGLKVLVKENHRAPVAVSMIWYNVGSADEPGGITGISHVLEHMMFKGTPKYPVGQFSKIIASLGGQENAFTNNDYTAYFVQVDANQLAKAFALEADRMTNLSLDEKEFNHEIKVIQEERRMRTDDNPQALAFERFLATAHLSSPYHHPVIGWMSDLQQIKDSDVRKWYQTYYAPNNATLVVVGDVDPKKVHKLAQKYFGTIKPKTFEMRRKQTEPPALGKKSIIIHATAKVPLVLIGYTVPSVTTATKPWEPYALEVIAGILSAGDSSRFSTELVRNAHIASSADVFYNLYARYQTQFIVFASPSQSGSLTKLQKDLINQLDALKTKPVSNQELQRVKNQIIAQKTFEKDSIFGQAMELGLLETVGIGWQKSQEYTKQIERITPKQIQEVAKRYFTSKNQTSAQLIPSALNQEQ